MTEHSILVVCHEPDLARSLARTLELPGEIQVASVASVEQALSLRRWIDFVLVLVYVGGSDDPEPIDALLCSGSRAGRALPLIVVSDRYNEVEGLTYFERGVTDYLSLQDHAEDLARVVRALVLPRAEGRESETRSRPVRLLNAVYTRVVSQLS